MFSTPRISWKSLGQLCRRLGHAYSAGLDLRKTVERESESGPPLARKNLRSVSEAINRGDSMTAAIDQTGDFFPLFFREMIEVGEKTGRLDRVLPQLADYYEHLVKLRRTFLQGIAWPVTQLVISLAVIGVLILALGWVANMTGQETDLLGFGLVGFPGLVRYLLGIGLVAATLLVASRIVSRGPVANWLSHVVMRMPVVGKTAQLMALSRMSWALAMATESGTDARHAVKLALNSTSSDYYRKHVPDVDQRIRQGQELHVTLRSTNAFPDEFLHALEVGEESGRLGETMLKMAEIYQDQAKSSMAGTTFAATIVIWGLVFTVLIFLIFRVFSIYASHLDPANYGL